MPKPVTPLLTVDAIIIFEKDKEVTFQVKRKEVEKFENADYFITSDPSEKEKYNNNRILSSEWLLNVVENRIYTKQWVYTISLIS